MVPAGVAAGLKIAGGVGGALFGASEAVSLYDRFVTRPRTRRRQRAAQLEFALDDTFAQEQALRSIESQNEGLGAEVAFLRGFSGSNQILEDIEAANTRDFFMREEAASLSRISSTMKPNFVDIAASLGF